MPSFATFNPGITKDLNRFELYDFGIGSIEADGATSGYPGHLKVLLRQKADQTRAVLLLVDFPLAVGYKIIDARDKKTTFDSVAIRVPDRDVTLRTAGIISFKHFFPNPELILQFKSMVLIRH